MTNRKGLVAAHTRKMQPIEEVMNRMASSVYWDFDQLTESQQKKHDEWAAYWDLLKADRDMARLVDEGQMTIDQFNEKKLAS